MGDGLGQNVFGAERGLSTVVRLCIQTGKYLAV